MRSLIVMVALVACGGSLGCSGSGGGPPADAAGADAAADGAAADATAGPDVLVADAGPADAPGADASLCGNGVIDPGEQCEGFDLGGRDCVDVGFDYGALVCGADCRFDTSFCVQAEVCDNGVDDDGDATVDCEDASCAGEPPCPRCGNGVIDPGEQCDDTDLGGHTCMDLGYAGGVLGCGACVFDPSLCTDELCANGIDDDGDFIIDCGDSDCDPWPGCGPDPTGGPCYLDTSCDGGVCLEESTGWPEGYCTELCDLAAGLCGSDADAWCVDDGSGDGIGHCLAVCTLLGTDCRPMYRCDPTIFGFGVCIPE